MELSHPKIQKIKKLFFTYRNGILADMLHGYGDPHRTIFGLDVPQISAIARLQEADRELAEALWHDSDVRESRLLASYLFPKESVSFEDAMRLASEIRTREEADMLSFRLFKHLSFARLLLEEFKSRTQRESPAPAFTFAYTSLLPHLKMYGEDAVDMPEFHDEEVTKPD